MRFLIKIVIFFSITLIASSGRLPQQESYPQGDFISPLTIPLSLSGTFGELRPDHFHAGLDLRTESKEGYPVIAIADGYVSRVVITPRGYGKMIFIDHPNGYTSTYAHLQKFYGPVADFVKHIQYKEETYEIEMIPPKGHLKVKQGDTIALSGNTGSSAAPHLHFEIRDTRSGWVLNPLLFRFPLFDNLPPILYRLKIFPLDEKSVIQLVYAGKEGPVVRNYFTPVEISLVKRNGVYQLSGPKEVRVKGNIGLGVHSIDNMNGSGNVLGVYEHTLRMNGNIIYQCRKEAMSYKDLRYLNAHIDYERKVKTGSYLERMYLLPGNKVSIYPKLVNNGKIGVTAGDSLDFVLSISDFFGNSSLATFRIWGIEFPDSLLPKASLISEGRMLYCNQPNVFTGSEVYIAFPENTFYTDVNFRYQMKARVAGTYSSKHVLQDDIIPVHAYFTLRIKTIGLPEKYQDKVVIASPNGEGGYKSYGGTYENGFVSTSLRTFGTFTVVIDTIPPVITSLNIFNNSNLAYAKSIDLTIYDKLSGISYYKATVDGKFILMERSAKNKLTYYFDDHVDRGEHIFRLEVTDNVGNTKVAEYNFRR